MPASKRVEVQGKITLIYDPNYRTPIDMLKVWLDKTPFKSTNAHLKKDTFYAIIHAVMALKAAEIDTLCGDNGHLNDKLSLTLCKYLFKAFEIISNKDQGKFYQLLICFYSAHISRAEWLALAESTA